MDRTVDNVHHVLIPPEYREHPLVADRAFYVLPLALLDCLKKECGQDFDRPLLEMEYVLARKLSHDQQLVGYRRGEAFGYDLLALEDLPLPVADDETLAAWGITRAEFEQSCRLGAARIAFYRVALRGYAGWLMTNRQFLQERDELFVRWHAQLATEGIPQTGWTFFGKLPHVEVFQRVTTKSTKGFLEDFARFYARWRLEHLVTPELPEPLAPQIPLRNPMALLTHMKVGGVTLYQPDTMPVPPRDRLRDILEEIRTNAKNGHLREWLRIVGRSRRSNHAMSQFAQLFTFHHYWTVVHERHPGLFSGNVLRIQRAFANYLHVSSDAVDKYRQKIKRRLYHPTG